MFFPDYLLVREVYSSIKATQIKREQPSHEPVREAADLTLTWKLPSPGFSLPVLAGEHKADDDHQITFKLQFKEHVLTRIEGFLFRRGAARLTRPQSVCSNHPELVLCPGEQIHHCGFFGVPFYIRRSCRETPSFNPEC